MSNAAAEPKDPELVRLEALLARRKADVTLAQFERSAPQPTASARERADSAFGVLLILGVIALGAFAAIRWGWVLP